MIAAHPAPWADEPARSRLADVAAALPELADGDAVVATLTAALAGQAQVLDHDGIVLYAGTNAPTPLQARLHAASLASRPSMGYPGDKYQTGLEHLDVLEVAAARLVAASLGAAFAEVRIESASLANLAVYAALCAPGDTIAVLPACAGGHASHHATGAPAIRGLRVVDLPYDTAALDVDLDALRGFLAREEPRLVVVGASLLLFGHRLPAIAEAVHAAGATLLYDAAHVAGVIAGGHLQAPLAEGADLVTFSTYKSFGGPPGGAIVGDDAGLMARVADRVYPGLTANYDASRLAPLALAALDQLEQGPAYADAMVGTAQALAQALLDAGLAVVGAGRGFTESHHVCVDAASFGGGVAAARRLAAAGIYLSDIGDPRAAGTPDAAAAGRRCLRIGTQEIVRRGFTPADAGPLAALVARVLVAGEEPAAVRRDAVALRRAKGDVWRFCRAS